MTLPTIAGVQSRIHSLPARPPFMIIRELAEVAGMEARLIARQFQKHRHKFPQGYFFVLTAEEYREKSALFVQTSQGSRTDLEQVGFTEKGALFLFRFITSDQADAATIMLIDAFADLRERHSQDLRHETCIDKQEYIGKSKLRQRIMAAAEAGIGYWALWGRWDYSHRVLTAEIEAMRVRGYIGPNALIPLPYIKREIAAKQALIKASIEEETKQPSLFGEG